MIGQRIAHYKITERLGAGGMGEVYRATDPKLNREVALKILPQVFAADSQRLARFQREAKVLASLNHPNIGAIYGLEDAGQSQALVLELIEGPTLAERIAEGPVPLQESLEIALQIAEALEAAHDKGVIHRDLKPANVKITPGGQVKVLDFGLAKAMEGGPAHSSDLSQSPTLSMAATRAGMILGTARYMSPEQARGKEVDRRADIWSFGVVLFEMLSGGPPFGGETVTDVMAAVVSQEPAWSELPAWTPRPIRRLLARCLRKEVRQRLHDVADARLEILDAQRGSSDNSQVSQRHRPARELVAWSVALLAVMALLVVVLRVGHPLESAPSTYRFTIPQPGGDANPPAISPDGHYLVYESAYVAGDLNKKFDPRSGRRLWLRRLEEAEPHPLEGTDGGRSPFWSPDSRSIGFFSAGRLKKIGISGTPPETLAKVPGGWPVGSWSRGGRILIEITENPTKEGWYLWTPGGSGLTRIRAFAPDRPIDPDKAFPHFLPDGIHFLFTHPRGQEAWLQVGSIESEETQPLVRADSGPAYAAPGFILYVRQGSLLAQGFDREALKMQGEPVQLLDDIQFFAPTGRAGFSVSQEGTLVFRRRPGTSRLEWLDRDGRKVETMLQRADYQSLKLSRSARRLAVGVRDPRSGAADIWLVDLERPVPTRLTSSPRGEFEPRWSPDGKQLAFSADWQGPPNLYLKDLGGGEPKVLVPFDRNQQYPCDWTPDGRQVIYTLRHPTRGLDIWAVDVATGERHQILATEFEEGDPSLSPDGRTMAYTSDASGQSQVYLEAFPGGENRSRVSLEGGSSPRWRGDGKELFYFAPGGYLMAVQVNAGRTLEVGRPAPLFRIEEGSYRDYDVRPDGQRFLFNLADPGADTRPDEVVVGWTRLLHR